MKLKKYNNNSFYRNNKNNNNNKDKICINCGKLGHIHKTCSDPIKSYGILCLKIKNLDIDELIYINEILHKPLYISSKKDIIKNIYDKIKNITPEIIKQSLRILMINRRNTISIIEFIRGKYTIKDYKYLLILFYQMTNKEKYDLLNYDFDYNWKKIWLLNDINDETHKKEYMRSKKNYKLLKDGIISNNINVSLESIIQTSCDKFKETEWGFPKGRKNINEDVLKCAKREFYEETNIKEDKYKILNIQKINELYMSSNNIKYDLIYYISQYISKNDKLKINCSRQQKIEVLNSKWLNYYEIISKIRKYNIQKINIVNTIYYYIIGLISEIKNKIENNIIL